jgi:hypothetical protein
MERAGMEPSLAPLRELPFVKAVRLAPGSAGASEGLVVVRSPVGDFRFTVVVEKSHIQPALLGSLLALNRRLEKAGEPSLLLLARYVPRLIGEQLVRMGVSFVDRSGNLNLRLGSQHQAVVLGNRDCARSARARRLSPGVVQVLFTALVKPEALGWPVRQLAEVAGVGKSTAAEIRRQMVNERITVVARKNAYAIAGEKAIRERFLLGYSQVLRPHLTIGRFRSPDRRVEDLLKRVESVAARRKLAWALTGSAGAYELDRFFRGHDTVMFIDSWTPDAAKELRLLPDPNGPIALLRPFGSLFLWPRRAGRPVAHPWLLYAELLHNGEPRAIEAAEVLRENHLK